SATPIIGNPYLRLLLDTGRGSSQPTVSRAMTDTTASNPGDLRAQSRRSLLVAASGAALGGAILLASWFVYPAFTLASLSDAACQPNQGMAAALYTRGAATLYVTAGDILWPDKFNPSGTAIHAAVLGYEIDPAATGTATWNLQVLHALRLEDPYGKPLDS